MANITKGGFRPWGTVSGGEGFWPGTRVAEVASNYATGIFRFDCITQVSDGTVAVSGDDAAILGVAVGFSYVISGRREPMPYIPANTTFTPSTVGSPTASYVEFIPFTGDMIFEVDGNAAWSTPTPAGVIGLIGTNCDIATGSGDTTTGVSAMTLALSTSTTATQAFRIIGLTEYPHMTTNDVTLSRTKFLVICNEGFYPPYTATGI